MAPYTGTDYAPVPTTDTYSDYAIVATEEMAIICYFTEL